MASQFADMRSSSNLFDVVVFVLSSLVTSLGFMSISWLVLESWQFLFIKDWIEIQKSEIHLSEFCPISGDLVKLGIPNSARMSLMKCQDYSFYRFWVYEGKPTEGWVEEGGGENYSNLIICQCVDNNLEDEQ